MKDDKYSKIRFKKNNNKNKLNTLKTFNNLFSKPMTCALTGFGFFWFYKIFNINIWFSFIIGLYVSALMSKIIFFK